MKRNAAQFVCSSNTDVSPVACDRLPDARITIAGMLSCFNAWNMKQSSVITEKIWGLWGESETGSVVRASITGWNLTCVTFRILSLSLSVDHFVFIVLRKVIRRVYRLPFGIAEMTASICLVVLFRLSRLKIEVLFLIKIFPIHARGNFCSVLCRLPHVGTCTWYPRSVAVVHCRRSAL